MCLLKSLLILRNKVSEMSKSDNKVKIPADQNLVSLQRFLSLFFLSPCNRPTLSLILSILDTILEQPRAMQLVF